MEIISISLDNETVNKLEEIEKKSSFNGRSELFRKLIHEKNREIYNKEGFQGEINSVMVVRHRHGNENELSKISHSYDSIINTRLHDELSEKECIEIFQLEGEAEELEELRQEMEGSRSTESVDFLPQI